MIKSDENIFQSVCKEKNKNHSKRKKINMNLKFSVNLPKVPTISTLKELFKE